MDKGIEIYSGYTTTKDSNTEDSRCTYRSSVECGLCRCWFEGQGRGDKGRVGVNRRNWTWKT